MAFVGIGHLGVTSLCVGAQEMFTTSSAYKGNGKNHAKCMTMSLSPTKTLGIQSPCQMKIGVYNHCSARYLGSITILRR